MNDPARTDTGDGRREEDTAGALLRAARERQGMHIATLAAAIKVAPRKLEALEQDRWDELPGPTFTRALAQAVCRALKTDPQPVMDLLPPADTSMLDSTFGSINEPFSGRAGREPGFRGWIPRGPWLIAAIVLLLAAALVMWLPAGFVSRLLSGAAPVGESSTAIATPSPMGATAVAPTTAPAAVPPAANAGPAAPAAPPATVPAAKESAVAGAPSAAVPRADAPSAAPASATVPTAMAALPAGELIFQCSGRSWIEVVDARGRVLVSRNLEAGESLGLDGPAPLQVVVGNVGATRVSFKGTPVDLEPRARDNVARFDLK
ncbi:MAG: helix-turn-helix domain-containing protein [Burkholderiales bacterium]|nr:helix-turn-helix domain-containing protein [Burkholderiales bacterium]